MKHLIKLGQANASKPQTIRVGGQKSDAKQASKGKGSAKTVDITGEKKKVVSHVRGGLIGLVKGKAAKGR